MPVLPWLLPLYRPRRKNLRIGRRCNVHPSIAKFNGEGKFTDESLVIRNEDSVFTLFIEILR